LGTITALPLLISWWEGKRSGKAGCDEENRGTHVVELFELWKVDLMECITESLFKTPG